MDQTKVRHNQWLLRDLAAPTKQSEESMTGEKKLFDLPGGLLRLLLPLLVFLCASVKISKLGGRKSEKRNLECFTTSSEFREKL